MRKPGGIVGKLGITQMLNSARRVHHTHRGALVTMTIQALAFRAADHITEFARQGEI